MPPAPRVTPLRQRALENVADWCIAKARAADAFEQAAVNLRQAVIDAHNLGCSYEQIAEAAGLSKSRVHQIARGTTKKPRPPTNG